MRLFRFVFWFIVLVIALVLSAVGFLFAMTPPASASEWSERTCVMVANDAGTLHDFKMQGMTWEVAEPQVRAALEAARTGANSYVRDEVDVERSLEVARFIWAHELDREVAVEIVFYACRNRWMGIEI